MQVSTDSFPKNFLEPDECLASGYKIFLPKSNNYKLRHPQTLRLGMSFRYLLHHQSEDADVVIGILVIPVVAVQAVSIEITEVEAIAISIADMPNTI